MFPLDRQLLELLNGLVGQSRPLFELALLLCGEIPLVGTVAVMLALWWTDAVGGSGASQWSIGPRVGGSPGIRVSRRRCVGLAGAVASSFVCTRLIAFAADFPRPIGNDPLLVPIDPERWGHLVTGMTGFGAFPSDHAALYFAVAVGMFAWSTRLGIGAIAVATVLTLARVAVGFHYPSDMYVGAAIGAGLAWAATFAVRRSPTQFDLVVRMFDEHPTILYPLVFVVGFDFTQHFRMVFRAIFSTMFRLFGS